MRGASRSACSWIDLTSAEGSRVDPVVWGKLAETKLPLQVRFEFGKLVGADVAQVDAQAAAQIRSELPLACRFARG